MAGLLVDSSAGCTALRRRLGATAWFVLEELVIHAVLDGAGLPRVQASTRELAGILNLNKDTVTRALARLRVCGVITAVARGGATQASVFAINLPADLIVTASVVDVDAVSRAGKQRRTRGDQSNIGGQLSLLR